VKRTEINIYITNNILIMKTIQINLGMGNNPMSKEEVENFFMNHKEYRLMACYFIDKTFQGEVENTFVAMLEHKYARESKVLADVESWCNLFTQESIAFVTDRMEALAFNHKYSGEGYKFDSELFEYIKK